MRTLLLVLPLVVQGGLIPSRPLHRRTQQPLLAAQQPAPKKGSASEWESARSDSTISNSSSMPLDGMASPPINGWYDSLHQQEYRLLRLIQRTPGLMPISLAVHYSLLPKVITPLLSLICWLASFPLGVSLVTFVCAQDCVNSAIKWAVQRPRPRWYSPEAGEFLLVGRIGAWEVDLSFPSAHTQFFSGMAFCTAALLRRARRLRMARAGAGVAPASGATRPARLALRARAHALTRSRERVQHRPRKRP